MAQSKGAAAKEAAAKEAMGKGAAPKEVAAKEVDNVKVNKDGFEIGKPIEPSAFISFLAKMRQEAK